MLTELLADLRAESADLDSLVAGLDPAGWATPTPAPGWTIAHQIAHLAWTDDRSNLAIDDPDEFRRTVDGGVDAGAAEGARAEPGELLARWRAGRERLQAALTAAPAEGRLVWYGPPMKPASMATARIMETWAHGQDVADALGVEREPTARLRHIAHLGVRTFGFSFALNDLPVPDVALRVELRAPDGDEWTWGPETAADRVSGPALDFCLLVTQRRHRDDLAITAVGEDARRWLTIAQAFAGTPGTGRAPTAS
ncbi:TIGR03084 family metal-binding protein [Saccharopolyspora sp. NPDC050389]|uniref:TIGR03084 family metal-binding protein n=1 Tax=Saccharopolyspora sp. NPDC050389 TaxID=3155516 RepID=UPI003403E852